MGWFCDNKNIFVSLTYKCNAFCKKCMTRYHINRNNEMSEELLFFLLKYLQKHNYSGLVSVGTGEPLLYDKLGLFADTLFSLNDNIRLRLLTNGMALSGDLPDSLFSKRCKIGITFDAFYQETLKDIQTGVNIEEVKSSIENICDSYGGDCLYLNYTLYNNNIDEFIPFCQFALDNGIKEIYVTELKIYEGYEGILGDKRVLHDNHLDSVMQQAEKLLSKYSVSAKGLLMNERPLRDKCYLTCKASPIIDVDGKVTLCSGREDIFVGNITDEDFDLKYKTFSDKLRNAPDWCSFCHDRILSNGNYSLPNTIRR